MIGIVLVRVKGFFFFFFGRDRRRRREETFEITGFGLQTVKPIPSSRYTTGRTSFRT